MLGSRQVVFDGGQRITVTHPWPFGPLEAWWLSHLVARSIASAGGPLILWIADPKSATVLDRLQAIPRHQLVRVVDAYDAWDLSPLVRGRLRLRAIRNGYRTAARRADIVFANTSFMADRMRALGAGRAIVLPNAAPPVDAASVAGTGRSGEPMLVYVGRIHERVDADLLATVADAFPGVAVRLIGPVERVPEGWADLMALPNVHSEPALVGEPLRQVLAGATALLLPHLVDDYTRSQDSMKAWDAIAAGTPVVATPLPPVDRWPAELGVVGADRERFVAGVRFALEGGFDASREARLAYARANTWEVRAREALAAIGEVGLP